MKILLKTEIFIRKWFQTIEFMKKYLLGFFIDGAAPENLYCVHLQWIRFNLILFYLAKPDQIKTYLIFFH